MKLSAGPKRIDWVRSRAKADVPSIAVRRIDSVMHFSLIAINGPSIMCVEGEQCWLVTDAEVIGTR